MRGARCLHLAELMRKQALAASLSKTFKMPPGMGAAPRANRMMPNGWPRGFPITVPKAPAMRSITSPTPQPFSPAAQGALTGAGITGAGLGGGWLISNFTGAQAR